MPELQAMIPERPMDVKLVDVTDVPFDLSIATARTCYSSKGIITPEDVSRTPESRALRDRIARSTLQAGHLTTRQHVHFVFAIDNASRHLPAFASVLQFRTGQPALRGSEAGSFLRATFPETAR